MKGWKKKVCTTSIFAHWSASSTGNTESWYWRELSWFPGLSLSFAPSGPLSLSLSLSLALALNGHNSELPLLHFHHKHTVWVNLEWLCVLSNLNLKVCDCVFKRSSSIYIIMYSVHCNAGWGSGDGVTFFFIKVLEVRCRRTTAWVNGLPQVKLSSFTEPIYLVRCVFQSLERFTFWHLYYCEASGVL